MNEIYLTSARTVRDIMPVFDNVEDKFILSAIREAQDIKYKAVVGADMVAKLKALVDANTLTGVYAQLLQESQYFLVYSTVSLLLPKVQYKITNAGVVTTSDDNVTPVTAEVLEQEITRYQYKADAVLVELQAWILDHLAQLPEISTTSCKRMRANLYDSSSCNVWLGGVRNPTKLL